MNKKTENNKLIADFMGLSVIERHGELLYAEHDGMENVKYDFEWNWLMQVVERIEMMSTDMYHSFTVTIAGEYCSVKCHEKNKQDGVLYQTPYGATPEDKITAVYDAVIEFIKWYNK